MSSINSSSSSRSNTSSLESSFSRTNTSSLESSFSSNSSFSSDDDLFPESEESLTNSHPSSASRYNSPFSCSSPASSSSSPAPQGAIDESALIAYAKQLSEIMKTDTHCQEVIAQLSAQAAQLTEKGKTRARIGTIEKLNIHLMVTGHGEVFLLFSQKAPFGEGTFKRYHHAISTKTWSVAGVCFQQPNAKFPANFRKDYKHVKHLTDRIIPKSYVHGEDPCWLEAKLDGNLGEALDDDLILTKDPATQIDVSYQMADQLAKVHEKGKVHRDVKLSNYLYRTDEKGSIKIAIGDFGTAIAIGDRSASLGGTQAYLPPQYFSRDDYDFSIIQNDSWSLGISLLFAFCNELNDVWLDENPKLIDFINKSYDEKQLQLWQMVNWQLAKISQEKWLKEPANNKSLEYVIWKLLQINPADRWTAREAANALQEMQNIPRAASSLPVKV